MKRKVFDRARRLDAIHGDGPRRCQECRPGLRASSAPKKIGSGAVHGERDTPHALLVVRQGGTRERYQVLLLLAVPDMVSSDARLATLSCADREGSRPDHASCLARMSRFSDAWMPRLAASWRNPGNQCPLPASSAVGRPPRPSQDGVARFAVSDPSQRCGREATAGKELSPSGVGGLPASAPCLTIPSDSTPVMVLPSCCARRFARRSRHTHSARACARALAAPAPAYAGVRARSFCAPVLRAGAQAVLLVGAGPVPLAGRKPS